MGDVGPGAVPEHEQPAADLPSRAGRGVLPLQLYQLSGLIGRDLRVRSPGLAPRLSHRKRADLRPRSRGRQSVLPRTNGYLVGFLDEIRSVLRQNPVA